MSDDLSVQVDFSDPGVVSAYDELSLWSAMFGLMLLDRIPMRPNLTVLDIGYGAGFPMLELAQRLGPTCKVYGIDTWAAARQRAEFKAHIYQLHNVEFYTGDASHMPFPDGRFDLLVSNLGVNNFANPSAAMKECWRVARPKARLALTSNLQGHMQEFYDVFAATLREQEQKAALNRLSDHIAHRVTVPILQDLLERAGFRVVTVHQQTATMRFLDGSALLHHSFIRWGFLESWLSVVEPEKRAQVFPCLEANLNRYAQSRGDLALTIPMVYVEAEK